MSLHSALIGAVKHVDVEIARLTEIRAALVTLDHDKPANKRRHISAATRRRMSLAARKRWKKASR